MDREYEQTMAKAGVAMSLFSGLGFEFADKSSLSAKLKAISPSGSTAMRDAIMTATTMMLELWRIISTLGGHNVWNFVHIVLTDGDDNASKTSLDDASAVMYTIGRTLNVSVLKTYFIGVDLLSNSKAAREIATLALSGGENAEYFNINEVQINEIFEKIKVGLGILQRTQMVGVASGNVAAVAYQKQIDPVLLVKKQKYVVLFTLDVSGSMSGSKWRRVCESVSRFTSFLGAEDLVGGIVFNDTVKIVLSQTIKTSRPQISGGHSSAYNYSSNNNNNYNQPLLAPKRVNNECTCKKCLILLFSVIFFIVFFFFFLTFSGIIRI